MLTKAVHLTSLLPLPEILWKERYQQIAVNSLMPIVSATRSNWDKYILNLEIYTLPILIRIHFAIWSNAYFKISVAVDGSAAAEAC